ncbi:PREDICTED: G patch domain-containing protein 4 [Trachymyrmex cornetzi]|uniref:G patch domain-containing protein 4 n=1 Tax=Trachymyrmex cornetzi TaxID=471704 RepID=A0A195DKW1_9HYME|nr:PREDICTED: G patch domain-containing protein 4 [Trachymyrmex cornetzi]KYN13477.1 G patch domain-containing protein 4 [Trachymyrmex cornetzi]
MANFAMRELLKYGWEEGEGLGKNKNGITEPIKLATNQNKAGIGYDEYKPWWDRLFNDTVKNIKVELNANGKEFSLKTGNMATALTDFPGYNLWKKSVTNPYLEHKVFGTCSDSENLSEKTCAHMIDQKVGLRCNKTMHESTEHNFTSNGKLERIAQQDALYLNTNPLLSDALVDQKNDIADSNAESDIEENKRETINASILQCLEDTKDFVLSKTTKKMHKKKLHKLIQELNTCNLEENNNQRQDYLDMKLKKIRTQRMKKDMEESKNLKKIVSLYQDMEERKNFKTLVSLYNSMTYDASNSTSEEKITGGNLFFQHTKMTQDKLLSKVKRKSTDQTSDILRDVKLLERCEKKKDSKAVNSLFEHIGKVDARNKYNKSVEEINRNFYFLNLNKIQKKKNLRPPSKEIKKIAEKLKGEALANELNSTIKNLTIFGITDKSNANTAKKKLVVPTQTHLTPV